MSFFINLLYIIELINPCDNESDLFYHLFQRILGSKLDPQLQYFGRSLDGYKDLNDDTIPDISVGAYGKVVQLW